MKIDENCREWQLCLAWWRCSLCLMFTMFAAGFGVRASHRAQTRSSSYGMRHWWRRFGASRDVQLKSLVCSKAGTCTLSSIALTRSFTWYILYIFIYGIYHISMQIYNILHILYIYIYIYIFLYDRSIDHGLTYMGIWVHQQKEARARIYGHWAENPNHVWALIDSTRWRKLTADKAGTGSIVPRLWVRIFVPMVISFPCPFHKLSVLSQLCSVVPLSRKALSFWINIGSIASSHELPTLQQITNPPILHKEPPLPGICKILGYLGHQCLL